MPACLPGTHGIQLQHDWRHGRGEHGAQTYRTTRCLTTVFCVSIYPIHGPQLVTTYSFLSFLLNVEINGYGRVEN